MTDSAASLREQRRLHKDKVSREQILDAAERIFGRKGFHGATLKEIADEAEFSVGALYGFFESKDDLFVQVLDRQGTALAEQMQASIGGVASARERLHRIAAASLDYFRARPDFYRLFQRELGGGTWSMRASLNERGFERYRAVMEFETNIFAEGVAAGELRDEDPSVMAALFSGLLQAYIAEWVFGLGTTGESDLDARYPLERLHALIDRAFVAA